MPRIVAAVVAAALTASCSSRAVASARITAGILAATQAEVSAGATRTVALAAPGQRQIQEVLRSAVEKDDPAEHFGLPSEPLTISDGRAGSITAVSATRAPTGDGRGQAVFLWHDAAFVQPAEQYEVYAVANVESPKPGSIAVTYLQYRPSDALCCPHAPPVTVSYTWDGHTFVASRGLPKGTYGEKIWITVPSVSPPIRASTAPSSAARGDLVRRRPTGRVQIP